MTTATRPPVDAGGRLVRDTATITALNLLNRLTGFVRVVAMAAALGTTTLGDTYQSANLVSNILFELLAGGLLSAILIPPFVERLDRGDREGANRLAGMLLGRTLAALLVVVAVAMVLGPWLMRLLTLGVADGDVRDQQVRLGTFLLVFFLPQVLLYAINAVSRALLNADRRFVAAAVAPVFNNLVVIATMVAFRILRDGATTLPLSTSERLVLAIGTTGGVLAMTAVPWLALRRTGLSMWPRWSGAGEPLRPLAAQGFWAAGHLGLNQALVAVTIVLAARVEGGVVAYQIAFTFFLLPHALLANPLYTALFPRLSADAAQGRHRAFADDLARGLRVTAFLVLPAAGLLAVLAHPTLDVVRLGNLDAEGADLVGDVLAAYAVGLLGYSAMFLLTRAAYALGDARSPTVVNAVVTAAAAAAMVVASAAATGTFQVAVLGLVHAVAVTAGALALYVKVRAMIGTPVPFVRSLVRGAVFTVLAAGAAWAVADQFAGPARTDAALALALGGLAGGVVYVAGQWAAGAPELRHPLAQLRSAG